MFFTCSNLAVPLPVPTNPSMRLENAPDVSPMVGTIGADSCFVRDCKRRETREILAFDWHNIILG